MIAFGIKGGKDAIFINNVQLASHTWWNTELFIHSSGTHSQMDRQL